MEPIMISERDFRLTMRLKELYSKIPNFMTKGVSPKEAERLMKQAEEDVDSGADRQ